MTEQCDCQLYKLQKTSTPCQGSPESEGMEIRLDVLLTICSWVAGCFSLFGSLVITVVLTFIFPQNYDWNNMKTIAVFNDISSDVSPISSCFFPVD